MKRAAADAETVALKALAFVAGDDEELGRFLALSGLSPAELRASAGRRETLSAVLGYVMGHETTAKGFAEAAGLSPDDLGRAAHALGAVT